jgi:hypothetical protein
MRTKQERYRATAHNFRKKAARGAAAFAGGGC